MNPINDSDAQVIKKFLEEAKAHFQEKTAQAEEVSKADPESASKQKAVLGARWTMYHCGTLLKYLMERNVDASSIC